MSRSTRPVGARRLIKGEIAARPMERPATPARHRRRAPGALAVVVLWLLASEPAFAASNPADFSGWWAVKIGERNLLVLRITVGKTGQVDGDLWRPSDFTLSVDTVDKIKGPNLREAITTPRFEHDGLTFTVANPDRPADVDRMLLRVTGGGHGRLMFDEAQTLPMDVISSPPDAKIADGWIPDKSYALTATTPGPSVSDPEVTKIFDADQSDRMAKQIDWSVVGKRDAARRVSTARLLAEGRLRTADDYFHAAFVFQHGASPDDFILAHALAMVAVKKGRTDAIWIASATLDRYLQNIGRSQIFGTQFQTRSGRTTQDPYDRALISDRLRAELNVPSQSAQEEQRKSIEKQDNAPQPPR